MSDVVKSKMSISYEELREQWGDLAAANIVGVYPSGTMTAAGAGDLAGRLTPFGRRFVEFLQVGAEEPSERMVDCRVTVCGRVGPYY